MGIASQLEVSLLPEYILSNVNLLLNLSKPNYDIFHSITKELVVAKERLEALVDKVQIDNTLRTRLTECLVRSISGTVTADSDIYMSLIVAGANAETILDDGTPLLFIKKGFRLQPLSPIVMNDLFKFYTNVNVTDTDGNNILYYFVSLKGLGLVSKTEALDGLVDGNISLIEKYIERGVNVNNKNKDGISALGAVVSRYSERSREIGLPFAMALLLNGADPSDITNCVAEWKWVEELSKNCMYILPRKGSSRTDYISVLRCGHEEKTVRLFRRYALDEKPACLACGTPISN